MEAEETQSRIDEALKHTIRGGVHTVSVAGWIIYRGRDADAARALHDAARLGASLVMLVMQQPTYEAHQHRSKRLKRTIAVRRAQ